MVLRIGFYLKDINDVNQKYKQLVCLSWDDNDDKKIEREITVKAEVVKMLTEKNYLKIFIQQYFTATDNGFEDSKTLQPIDMKKYWYWTGQFSLKFPPFSSWKKLTWKYRI